MRSPLIVATLGLLLLADVAQAQTLVQTSNIIVRAFGRAIDFTSDTTTSIRDSKVVREAHDDAATFVASQGDIRGVQLESAFNTLRDRVPEARTPATRNSPKPSSHCEAARALACRCGLLLIGSSAQASAASAAQDRRLEPGPTAGQPGAAG
jgi:uncharacterized protein (TIGR02448 family)